jgi:hypothetical protein
VTAAVIAPGAAADTATATQTVSCGDVPALIAAISVADAAGSGRIELARCTYTLTAPLAQTDASGPDGLPVITGQIEIAGNGATIARAAGAPMFRIAHVAAGGHLTLRHVTVTGGESATLGGGILADGALDVLSSHVDGNVSHGGGGGIGAPTGSAVAVRDSTVSGNATPGFNDGGGIASGGTLRIARSVLAHDSAPGGAGGAVQAFGTLDVDASRFEHDDAPSGGAVFDQGTASFDGATFAANTVSEVGGAVYVEPGKQLALDDSVLTGNESDVYGGAIYLDAGATLALDTTFVSLNRAGTSGGGIFVGPGASVTSHISFVFGNTPDDCFPSGSCGLAGP